MTGRVIQGFFLGGRAPASLQGQMAAPAAAPGSRTPIPPTALQPRMLPGRPALAHGSAAHRAQAMPGRPAPPVAPRAQAPAVQCSGTSDSFAVDPVQIGLARQGGQPLPRALLAKMEAAFDADFSGVRVHLGPQAARIGALAFTTGNDLYFAPGQYQPDSVRGQQLIGHELAHVIQQRQGRVRAPGSGVAVVQDRALEAEADRLGMRAAAHRAPVQAKRRPGLSPASPPGQAVQRYRILGQDKIYQSEPRSRPYRGYPYAVIPRGTHFSAQQSAGGGSGVNEFLRSNRAGDRDRLNRVDRRLDRVTLRVSDDSNMAIENSDLTGRQPKAFFATAQVINDANQARNAASTATLHRGGETITILTGWWSQKTLYRVTPRFTTNPAQNCDDLAGQVTGQGAMQLTGGAAVNDTIAALLDRDRMTFDMNAAPNVAAYVHHQGTDRGRERQLGLNGGARPEVGSAYMIHTTGYPVAVNGNTARVLDLASNTVRDLDWAFHFAAVVARSGVDRITLENYARGDNRRAGFDPRWYFQMYGEAAGQTFHEFHEARQDYANPGTVSVGPSTPLPWWG